MNRATRRNWTEEQARQVLARAEREGLSATELARELNVSAQKIYWWRQRLRADERTTEPRFMEVRVAAQLQAKPFAVQLRNGRTVAVWPGFDATSCSDCWQRWRAWNAELATIGAHLRGAGRD